MELDADAVTPDTDQASFVDGTEACSDEGRSATGAGDPDESSPDRPESWSLVPTRLHTPALPQDESIDPPVDTREQLLPFHNLTWQNFERLCLRLARTRGDVHHAVDHGAPDHDAGGYSVSTALALGALYGTNGQDQQGIDLYVLLPPPTEPGSRYLAVQSRRIAKLAPKGLVDAVSDFLAGSWATASGVFVYATSLNLTPAGLQNTVVLQRERLASHGIAFETWDAEYLSARLKRQPQIVDDFFGRAWVERFCDADSVARLGERLDVHDVVRFRRELARFYENVFDVGDSGLAVLTDASAAYRSISARFVLPDLIVEQLAGRPSPPAAQTTSMTASEGLGNSNSPSAVYSHSQLQLQRYGRAGSVLSFHQRLETVTPTFSVVGDMPAAGAPTVLGTSVESWLTSGERFVVVGGPGSGKSALLRYLVMDLLAPEPSLHKWAERFGGRLPVWLPFQYFAHRRATMSGAAASVEATLAAWLSEHDAAALWPLVAAALRDERLLLVIDGLDEAGDPDEGQRAAAALEVFLTQRSLPALVSTRPYGLGQLSLANRWSYASIAPLSASRQIELARLWLEAPSSQQQFSQDGHPGNETAGPAILAADASYEFMREVDGNPELRDLAQVPLFLVLLISLRLRGHRLPARRFDVYEHIIDQLVEKHPARRTIAALSKTQAKLRPRDIRQTLARLAFDYQRQGVFGPVPEHSVEARVRTALEDQSHLALPPAQAAESAQTFVEIVEGQIGVLIRHGPRHLGFLHRVLQEQLAAEHAAYRMDLDALRALFAKEASDPRWREVLLGILWRCDSGSVETLIGELAQAADGKDAAALRARELAADAVFGDYGLDAAIAALHARDIMDVIEQHPYLPHRARLLSAAVHGLSHPVIGPLLQERLQRWVFPGKSLSPGGYYHLGRVCAAADIDDRIWPILRTGLAHEDIPAAQAAAIAIANRYAASPRGEAVRADLIGILDHPRSADHAAMTLISLCLGWSGDKDVRSLLATARLQQAAPVRLVALAESLDVLRPLLDDQFEPDDLIGAQGEATDEDHAWLEAEVSSEDHSRRHWIPFFTEVAVAAAAGDPQRAERWREWCIETLRPNGHARGDRAIAWNVLLRGHGQHPAVIDFVSSLLTVDIALVHYLGVGPLARTYSNNERLAAAIEDALGRDQPGWLSRELNELAEIDHGPVIRHKLLTNFTEHGFAHWPAAALITHWPDDPEVKAKLTAGLESDPVRASQIATCAPKLLGPRHAIDFLLDLVDKRPDDEAGFRADFIAYALIEACTTLGETSGPTAERAARVCVQALAASEDWYEQSAEETVVARLSRTEAATARAKQLLAREDPPFDALLAGYGNEPAMLTMILDKLCQTQPQQPTPIRRHLYNTLRVTAHSGAFVRQLARSWPLEPHALVRSAASAAYHHHLQRDRHRGEVSTAELQRARQVIRLEAVASGLRPDSGENPGRRRSAWLGALLLEEPALMDDLHDHRGPATVNLGGLASEPDLVLLSEIADRWKHLRAHFAERLLHRLMGDSYNISTGEVWEYLTQVANRNEDLAREADAAIAAKPELLRDHDAILAWYSRRHSGQPALLDLLIDRLGRDHSNARALESLLLAEPESIGFDAQTVADRIRSQAGRTTPWGVQFIPEPAVEVLAEIDPDDATVRTYWEEILEGRQHSEPPLMHPRTYFPIAYAAMAASQFLSEIDKDIGYTRVGFQRYFAPQHARSARLRINRDPEVLAAVEGAILDPSTQNGRATQLASLLVGARPIRADVVESLTERLRAQLETQGPALVFDPVSGLDAPISLLLIDILYTATR